MRLRTLSVLALLAVVGCQSSPTPKRSDTDSALFGPVSMRIHPIFTQIKDWTGDNDPDGVDALVELQDQFGDPTKATGRVIFELFEYRQFDPDPRGERLSVWTGELGTLADQQARWNRTSRTYSFLLNYPQIDPKRGYILSATFELTGGARFYDRIAFEPVRTGPTTTPTTNPVAANNVAAAPTTNAVVPNEPGARRPAP